jgi:hypothetical protein
MAKMLTIQLPLTLSIMIIEVATTPGAAYAGE